jgi:hypothetical protein
MEMVQNQGGNTSDGSLKDLWLGIAITFGIYVIAVFVLMMFMGLIALILAFIAHITIIIICFQKGKKRMGQGLLIGLGLVILLIAACFGLLIYTFSFT